MRNPQATSGILKHPQESLQLKHPQESSGEEPSGIFRNPRKSSGILPQESSGLLSIPQDLRKRGILRNRQYTPAGALTEYTVHSTPYAVHSTQYTVHSTQYTVHSTQYRDESFGNPQESSLGILRSLQDSSAILRNP